MLSIPQSRGKREKMFTTFKGGMLQEYEKGKREYQSKSTNITVRKVEGLLQQIQEQGMLIEQWEEVSEHLKGIIAKDLLFGDVLLHVCQKISEEFHSNASIVLTSYQDPEYDERTLTIYIRQKTYEKNLMHRIRLVRAAVMPKQLTSSEWILIATDFKYPSS